MPGLTQSEEIKSLTEASAKLTQVAEDLTKTYQSTYEKWAKEVKSGTSETEIKNLANQLSQDVVPKLAQLTEINARLVEAEKKAKHAQDAVAAMELKAPPSSDASQAEILRNIGRLFTGSREYKHWVENLHVNSHGSFTWGISEEAIKQGKKSDLGSFWNAHERKHLRANAIERKAAGEFSSGNVGDGTRPYYRPDIVEATRRVPVMRTICPVIPTTQAGSVISTRETARRRLAAKLTATANSGSTTFTVDNVQGFEDVPPFNTFTLDNTVARENLTIQSINRTTGVITTTAASTINMAIGHYVYGSQFIITAEGQVAPRGLTVLGNYTVPICRISSSTRASLEMLRDIAQAEDFINRNLMDLVADSEDAQFFYGKGGTDPTRIKGLFYDSDVVQSARPNNVHVLNHILTNIYALANDNYVPNVTVVSVDTHQALAKLVGDDGNYLLWRSQDNGGMSGSLNVTRLVMTNMMVSGHALTGDMTRACTIYDREATEIGIHEVGDDATTYQRTLVANGRAGFGIERPLAARWMTNMI